MPNSQSTRQGSVAERTYTPREERRWNRLSDGMSYFHEIFKDEFNVVYELADGSFVKRGLSLRAYLQQAKRLNQHLTFHHTFEEANVFPVLAQRMPMFAADAPDGEHIKSHRAIHDGLDKLDALTNRWVAEPSTYSPPEMRSCLDGFREVLFRHLDEEVEDLKGDNLKKYWTLEEVDRLLP